MEFGSDPEGDESEELEIRFAEREAEEPVTVAAGEGGEEAVGEEGEGRVFDDRTEAEVGGGGDEEGDGAAAERWREGGGDGCRRHLSRAGSIDSGPVCKY